jgi:2-phospho-L-lactate guanylyltransferase
MNTIETIRALIPVKDFDSAKTRLRAVLQVRECAELAAGMAWDVATAARSAQSVSGVTLLGGGAVEDIARELGCDFMQEDRDADLSRNLDLAARQLEADGVGTLVIIPADLPTLRPEDIDGLLARAVPGLCVCPAGRDGGTNALVVTPPTAIQFHFGDRSAQRHLEGGRAADLPTVEIEAPAFNVDIDTPADLVWLCRQVSCGRTGEVLDRSGIRTRILEMHEALSA